MYDLFEDDSLTNYNQIYSFHKNKFKKPALFLYQWVYNGQTYLTVI